MIAINKTQGYGQGTTYTLAKTSENQFGVNVDWERSPGVNSGGYGLTFAEDRLEVRGYASPEEQWDILVAPPGFEKSVLVQAPPNGFRDGGGASEAESLSQVDFPSAIKPEESRRIALQVASSLIGVPFLDRLLEEPAPTA